MLIGLIAPETSWKSTVAWAIESLDLGVDSLWSVDSRDPITFLSALSQLVARGRFGLFISSIDDRPALMAAKQLITLDRLSGGRIDIVVDDHDVYSEIERAILKQLPPQVHRPTLQLWTLEPEQSWPVAMVVNEVFPGERKPGVDLVIARLLVSPET